MSSLPEPWLRGPIETVHPLLTPLLRSFEQAREDLEQATEGLEPDQIWNRPNGVAPVGFHVRHIGGSIDRLLTYAEGRPLDGIQLAALKQEGEPGASRRELLDGLRVALERSGMRVRAFRPESLTEPRQVGRKQLPTTVIGLLIHVAEHTQRHVGQAVTTAKVVRGLGPL